MLFVVIFSVSFLNISLQITTFGYYKEKLIDENYDYIKDIEIKSNQLSSSNYRGYGYTLVSSPMMEDSPEDIEIKYYLHRLRQSKYNNKRIPCP